MYNKITSFVLLLSVALHPVSTISSISYLTEQNIKINKVIKRELPSKKEEKTSNNGWKKLGKFYITAYCDCKKCQEGWVGTTATGVKPTPGDTIAVDPKVIPLGSKVKIDGKIYTASDTGGAIKGKRIDILLPNHKSTTTWKNKYFDVEIKVKEKK